MCGPAYVCRFISSSILTPIYRDYCSILIADQNVVVQNCQVIINNGAPRNLVREPGLGGIGFIEDNNTQYTYNRAGRHEVRELTNRGKHVRNAADWLGNVDDTNSWISLVGLCVVVAIIAAPILYPALRLGLEVMPVIFSFLAIFTTWKVIALQNEQQQPA